MINGVIVLKVLDFLQELIMGLATWRKINSKDKRMAGILPKESTNG
jgi:hypothetical protein